jgi:hypothetical protein
VICSVTFRTSAASLAAILALWGYGCRAQENGPPPPDSQGRPNSVLIFAGKFRSGHLFEPPFVLDHESNYIVGASFRHDLVTLRRDQVIGLARGMVIGLEAGAAGRFGDGASGEGWVGVSFQHPGFVLFHTVRVSPGLTIGLSVITKPIGIEAIRERRRVDNDADLLGYLGPELAFSFKNRPDLQVVYRTQHRSGAGGVLGHLNDVTNADTLGLRLRF